MYCSSMRLAVRPACHPSRQAPSPRAASVSTYLVCDTLRLTHNLFAPGAVKLLTISLLSLSVQTVRRLATLMQA
jgi:hypothetical protein